ncbi:MAG: phage tail protein [Anaerococcus vaginalis]|nr:phage tail protein [Anaerococcus vaginalis]
MLMLYDRDEKLIACLKYNKIERKRELNGLNNLEFETSKEVEYGQRTLFKDKKGLWNEYIIFDYFKNHENNDVTYSVYCEDSTSELYWYFVDDLKPRNATCSSVLRRLLERTRFEVGYIDDFPKKSFNLYRESVKSCLWKILDVYEAEINVRIVVDKTGIIHRYIDLRKRIGRDVGKRFTYKKDIGSIKKTTSIKDLCTALHGYGKGEEIVKEDGTPSRNDNKIGGGDYGRKIDFSEINGGKTYVEDNEARLKYGLGKERKHIFGQADFSDCEDKHELLRLTKERLKEVSKPKITYELKVEDISRYEGYIGEGVDLGDTVYVIDKEIDTRVQTRVISIKDNPIEEIEDSEIVLGNFIKDLSDNLVAYEKLKSTFENDRNKFNQELDKLANGVKSSYMQKILEKFNKELNETGGWVYAEEGEGLLILNAPKEGNPTQAINLKGGKIAIANHKNADGSFAYETFGDGDGFTANLIRAGVLKGGKVFFNLEDGTFLIGKSSNDYSMYWDGSTLHLRNTDIDLSNNGQIINLENKLDNANTRITQTANEISSKVSKYDFGTMIRQSASDIRIAWNNISNYIQFEYGTIGIYDGSVSQSKKRSMFDEHGIHFYRDGYYLGKIGTNSYETDNRKKGLVFDLEYEAAYMSWSVREKRNDNLYTMKWVYSNENFDIYKRDTLYAGCDLDMSGHTLKNVNFEGGGVSGTLNFQQIHSVASNGTANSWNGCTLRFKNGILVEGSWD